MLFRTSNELQSNGQTELYLSMAAPYRTALGRAVGAVIGAPSGR